MIVYHLDRKNSFPSDPSLQLSHPIDTINTKEANIFFNSAYPKGFSYTGLRYANPFDVKLSDYNSSKATFENFRIFTIEYVFEIVRMFHFPQCPSRFTSLFACREKKDVKCWYEILSKNSMDTSNTTVKIIETSNSFFIGDSSWRDKRQNLITEEHSEPFPIFSPFAYHEWAKYYWSGYLSENPKYEVLCELPVTVLDSIPYSSFEF